MRIFQAKGLQNISFLHGNRTVNMEDLYLWMLHDDQYSVCSEYNYCRFKFTSKLNPQVQLLFNLYIHASDIWWLTNCRDFWWCKKN